MALEAAALAAFGFASALGFVSGFGPSVAVPIILTGVLLMALSEILGELVRIRKHLAANELSRRG
jgi:hypothetical protein